MTGASPDGAGVGGQLQEGSIRFHEFALDRADERVIGPGGPLHLGHKAWRVLTALIDADGRLLTKDALFEAAWDGMIVSESALTSVIKELRRALGDDTRQPRFIESVYGRGYRFIGMAPNGVAGNGTAPVQPVEVVMRRDGTSRVAVLPFAAIGHDQPTDYFADGMVDQLITTLGRVPQLLVAGRTSSFHFRGSKLPAAEIAAALRVGHLVEGSVQRQARQVRINVRLIDGETGFEEWAQHYAGSLDDVFALQASVAEAVTVALSAALGVALQVPQARGGTANKYAYDLYLQGKSLMSKVFGENVLTTAITLLEQAVALDPEFAEAWATLGEAHQLVAVYTPCMDRAAASSCMAECARQAIAIVPDLAHPHSLLGIHAWTQNDVVGALDLAFKAFALEPDNPAVAMRLGSFLLYCGRTRDAMRYVESAIDLDPVDGRKYNLLSVGRFNLGDIAGAIEAGERMVDLGFPSMWLAVAVAANGDHARAVELYQQTKLLMNSVITPPAGTEPMPAEMMDAYWLVAARGVCSGDPDAREHYCRTLDMLHATLHDPADPTVILPAIFMGYAALLFRSLRAGVSPANTLCLLSIWSDSDPIRRIWNDPEFIPFAQRIGLADAWDKYGWPDLVSPPDNRIPAEASPA
ncbi:MAG: winged helix-turn-helix domain-containing tetratricopeptide repeat protein [Novosphingobium sp.]